MPIDLLRPCVDCGEPARCARCPSCRAERVRAVRTAMGPQASSHAKGYDQAWRALSARARRLQPWCSSCAATTDLTVDHSPEAWQAVAAGRAIPLDLVTVLCRSCNARKGAARSLKAWTQGGDPRPGDTGTTGGPTIPDTHRYTLRAGAPRRGRTR